MKGFMAVMLLMSVMLVVFTRALPAPSQPLSRTIRAELRNLKYLR